MNDLSGLLLRCIAQVTVFSITALLLVAVASRWGPRTAARAATAGLFGCLLVTMVAFFPLPDWWTLTAPTPSTSRQSGEPAAEVASSTSGDSMIGFDPLALLAALPGNLMPEGDSPSTTRGFASALVVGVLIVGSGLGVARLLFGLWSVARWQRRSLPLSDATLLQHFEDLQRVMNCPRPVEIRESTEVSSAATLGYWRPLVLLPTDWRSWTVADQRAVLAHEIAHICQSDYLGALIAHLGVALHFYHPLVRRLASWLHLHQELAADAQAAAFAGGRESYLCSLARLALRQDVNLTQRPVRTFLSADGTLLRRIAMLRTKKGCSESPLSGGLKVLSVSALTLGLLAATALRGPAQAQTPTPESAAPSVNLPSPTHVDLNYLPPSARGVYSIRPAALMARPGMKPYAVLVDVALDQFFRQASSGTPSPLHTSEIERIVGTVTVQSTNSRPDNQSSLMLSLQVIRTVAPIDWKKRLSTLFPKAREVPCKGGVYYTVALSDTPWVTAFASPQEANRPLACYFPDDRTLVLDSEERIRSRLAGEAVEGPTGPWVDDWKQAAESLIAVAHDARDKKWLRDRRQPETVMPQAIQVLLDGATSLSLGLKDEQTPRLTLSAQCPTAEEGRKIQKAINDEWQTAQARGTTEPRAPRSDFRLPVALTTGQMTSELAEREGSTVVTWQIQSKSKLADLVRELLAQKPQE